MTSFLKHLNSSLKTTRPRGCQLRPIRCCLSTGPRQRLSSKIADILLHSKKCLFKFCLYLLWFYCHCGMRFYSDTRWSHLFSVNFSIFEKELIKRCNCSSSCEWAVNQNLTQMVNEKIEQTSAQSQNKCDFGKF